MWLCGGKLQWPRAGLGAGAEIAWVRSRYPWLQARHQAAPTHCFQPHAASLIKGHSGSCHLPGCRHRCANPASLSAPAGTVGPLLRVYLLSPCSQQQLVPGALAVQQPEQEHMTRDALELQAEVSNLQLSHVGVDKHGKLPEPGEQTTGQEGSTEPGCYPLSHLRTLRSGGGRREEASLLFQAWLHWAPLPSWY